MFSNRKDRIITLIAASLLLLVLALLPEKFLFGGKAMCPTMVLFHFPCPLCGITRAAWLFLHGNWAEAWDMNAGIFPLALFYLALVYSGISAADSALRILKFFFWFSIGFILLNYPLQLLLH